jgi:hypothetical protein
MREQRRYGQLCYRSMHCLWKVVGAINEDAILQTTERECSKRRSKSAKILIGGAWSSPRRDARVCLEIFLFNPKHARFHSVLPKSFVFHAS